MKAMVVLVHTENGIGSSCNKTKTTEKRFCNRPKESGTLNKG